MRKILSILLILTVTNATADPRLAGTWIKACGVSIDGAHFDRVTFTVDGNQLRTSIENFTDAACTIPFQPAPNPTAEATITLGAEITATDGTPVIEIDTQITRFNGAPFDILDYSVIQFVEDGFYLGVDSGGESSASNRIRTLDRARFFARP